MASLFGITPQDLLAKLVPAPGQEDFAFSIGPAGPPEHDLSEANAMQIVAEQEAVVESYLRHKYQRLLRRVEGEVAVRFAEPGQTECRATLTPVTWLRVYRNYPRSRAWPDRRPGEAMREEEYVLDPESGVILFAEPLKENDRIWLDYEHGGAGKLGDLRHLVLSLAAVEVARRFAYFRTGDGFNPYEGWESSSIKRLQDLGRTDGAQIGLFDRIELVNETRNLNLGAL